MAWGKTDIIKYLSAIRGYRRYLEICTASTGGEFAKIDRSQFDTCHRLMYRCPDDFTDGLPIDFRVRDLDTARCVEDLHRKGQRYDIILVDPWHEYEPSYRDLETALSLVADHGTIVVHDCLPPSDETINPTYAPGAWCGVTFMAYVDFVARNEALSYRTVDTDYGCGIVRPRGEAPTSLPAELLDSWKEHSGDPKAAFQFMQANKWHLLQLVSIDEFIRAEADARR